MVMGRDLYGGRDGVRKGCDWFGLCVWMFWYYFLVCEVNLVVGCWFMVIIDVVV